MPALASSAVLVAPMLMEVLYPLRPGGIIRPPQQCCSAVKSTLCANSKSVSMCS